MDNKPFIDVELFPCAGGMARGFLEAGVHFDMAIEIEEAHCDSYEHNIGHRPIQMDARDFHRMLVDGWRPPKPVRMIVADPPCTPWSRAGKRMGQDDPRDMLDGTCRIIELLQPEVYLIGNVPGLDDGPNLHIVQKTIGALSKYGYCTADFARLNAANYGTPQHRHRPFWFGHKKGPCIQWPSPTHGDPDDAARPTQATLDIVTPLVPWITCRQALGHLPMEEIGRPIKLRRRTQNSAQHGSVPERPARTVGTSNLSDGNVILGNEQPRAKKRGGKNHGTPQGQRETAIDGVAPTITRTLHHTTLVGWDHHAKREAPLDHTPRYVVESAHVEPVIPFGLAHEIYGSPAAFSLELVGPPTSTYRARDDHRVRQGNRVGRADTPAATITAKPTRAKAGAHATIDFGPPKAVFTIQDRRGGIGGLNTMDAPSKAIVKNTVGNGSVIVTSKHPAIGLDMPATTIRGGGEGHSAPPVVLVSSKHPGHAHDQPAQTVRASDAGGNSRAMEWPWDRPSTTVLADERIGPPGHHDETYGILNVEGEGIVISERAAAILQAFPDTITCGCGSKKVQSWEIALHKNPDLNVCKVCEQPFEIAPWKFNGDTKKARFSQIGQAVPSLLARPVAESVVAQLEKTERAELLELNEKGRARDEALGRPFVMRTMFTYHGGDSKHYPLPIRDAVEWANSKRGEWQPSGGDGCARFGLCERPVDLDVENLPSKPTPDDGAS